MNNPSRDKKLFKDILCPYCASHSCVELFHGLFRLMLCNSCSLVFIPIQDRKPTNMYVTDYPISRKMFESALSNTETASIKRHVRWILRHLDPAGKNILDIGCGTGGLLAALQKRGAYVKGIEPSIRAALLADTRVGKENIECCFFENAEFDKKFDAIIMTHVLEHLERPQSTLQKAISMLKPTGLLFIVVPNLFSMNGIFRIKHFTQVYPSPNHFYIFSPKTLENMFLDSGFERISSQSFMTNIRFVAQLVINGEEKDRLSHEPENVNKVKMFYSLSYFYAMIKGLLYKLLVLMKLSNSQSAIVEMASHES